MKELTSKKTGKVNFVSNEIYEMMKPTDKAKYRVRDIAPIRAKPPVIEAPEKKTIEGKTSKK